MRAPPMAGTSNATTAPQSRVLGLAGPLLFFLVVLVFAFRGDEWVETLTEATRTQRQVWTDSFFKLCLWLAGAHLLNRALSLFIWDGVASRALGGAVPRLLRDFTAFSIYFIAFTGIVAFVFDKSITGLWATSGALGLVIGFALRGLILDIFTGLAINIDRPYRLEDWITVQGPRAEQNVTGKVVDMNWRTTRLQTEENVLIVIPNSIFGSAVVSNFYASGQATRYEAGFYVDYSVPTDRVRRVMLAGVKAVLGQRNILTSPEPCRSA